MTLYFNEIDGLRVSGLSAFIEQLRLSYPEIQEQFPLAAVLKKDDDPGVFVSARTAMPFPFLSFSDPKTGQIVSFQSDRFSLTWNFGNESGDNHYPGYVSLRDQLATLFESFSVAVNDQSGETPVVVRSQCRYYNSVTELPGTGLALYLLTGREDLTARDALQSRTYAGARVRIQVETDGLSSKVSAGVDSPNDDETVLWFNVVSESEQAERGGFDLLDGAHDELIKSFVQFTPTWLRDKWGESE